MRQLVSIAIGVVLVAGCAQQGDEGLTSAAGSLNSASFNLSGAPTIEFSVPDMMCPDSCAVTTREILAAQPGAKDVLVDFEAKTATVAIEEGKFNTDDALAALADRGFVHSALKSDGAEAGQSSL
jgi:copper chaperone CopZ